MAAPLLMLAALQGCAGSDAAPPVAGPLTTPASSSAGVAGAAASASTGVPVAPQAMPAAMMPTPTASEPVAAGAEPPSAPPSAQAISYQRDIRPLLERNCVECHGGDARDRIAPFSLDGWTDVQAAVMNWDVVGAIDSGRMPPWMPAPDCRPLAGDRSLPPAQRALFSAWRDGGYPEGDAAEYRAAPRAGASNLGPPSLVLQVPTAYTPKVDDEYTCFGVGDDSGALYTFPEQRFLTAIQVLPGEPSEVHHVQVHRSTGRPSAGPTDCSGAVTGSAENVFSWRPGSTPLVFPDGSASRIAAGNGVVIQIHYNAAFAPKGRQPDQTRVALWFMPEGQRPDALITRQQVFGPVNIPAGDREVSSTGSARLPAGTEIIGVTPHAHMLATRMSASVSIGGMEQCLVDIPKWDFHWQGDYLFEQPLAITGGAQVSTTCVWDNGADNQPMVNGMQLQPRNVRFGEGSFEEMCLHYLWLRRPYSD